MRAPGGVGDGDEVGDLPVGVLERAEFGITMTFSATPATEPSMTANMVKKSSTSLPV